MRRLAGAVLQAEEADGELSLAFVSEATVAELNGRYRSIPEPTDVLSFPGEGDDDEDWPEPQEEEGPYLGEVIVCPAVAEGHAREDDIALAQEIGALIIHGILHLLGYDHEADDGEMMARQEALLVQFAPLVPALLGGE